MSQTNVAQYRLRLKLKETGDTLPNQLDKEVQNPTLRWIFQIMVGTGMVRFYEKGMEAPVRELETNLTDLRRKIIRLFGPTACEMYGLIPKSSAEGLGMLSQSTIYEPNHFINGESERCGEHSFKIPQ